MKRIYILAFWLLALHASSQNNLEGKRDYIWKFGTSRNVFPAGFIDFNNNPPLNSPSTQKIDFSRTDASISDTTGNLLFFTNGMFVADRNGNIMPHGDSINYGYLYDYIIHSEPSYSLNVTRKHECTVFGN